MEHRPATLKGSPTGRVGTAMEATAVAQGYFDAWNRHDPAAVVAAFAKGGTYCAPNVPDGLSGSAIAVYAGELFAAFPDISFDVCGTAPAGDGVVGVRWTMRGTHRGDLVMPAGPIPPTGKQVQVSGITLIRFTEGKVVEEWQNADNLGFLQQLGVISTPGQ